MLQTAGILYPHPSIVGVNLDMALLCLFCLLLFSVHSQSRDWMLGNGYCVVIIGLLSIRNAILIIISITFSIICSLAFSLSF